MTNQAEGVWAVSQRLSFDLKTRVPAVFDMKVDVTPTNNNSIPVVFCCVFL